MRASTNITEALSNRLGRRIGCAVVMPIPPGVGVEVLKTRDLVAVHVRAYESGRRREHRAHHGATPARLSEAVDCADTHRSSSTCTARSHFESRREGAVADPLTCLQPP